MMLRMILRMILRNDFENDFGNDSGLCPTFCGSKYTPSYDYKSECDPVWGSAWSSITKYPSMKVCCQEYGFCGTNFVLCSKATVEEPSCSGANAVEPQGLCRFLAKSSVRSQPRQKKIMVLMITSTSPCWYMQRFVLTSITKIIDWLNITSYNLHGVRHTTDLYIGAIVNPSLKWSNFWISCGVTRSTVQRSSFVSISMAEASHCPIHRATEQNAQFSGGGKPGACTASARAVSYVDI